MQLNNLTQGDYSLSQAYYQLSLPLDLSCRIPENDPVRLLSIFVDDMDLEDLYKTYSHNTWENRADPRRLLKILLYAYMNHIYSSRAIETACRRDINFMFLLEGRPAPTYSTISRFRTRHFGPCAQSIMAKTTSFLCRIGELSKESVFIDGTKIEANANKYTFVWRKATVKNSRKLSDKIRSLCEICQKFYRIGAACYVKPSLHNLKHLRRELYQIKQKQGIVFVHGHGHHKSELQRIIEKVEAAVSKMKEYNHKIFLCAGRNSYSKTDHDATFMRLKEDAMLNGQLKPAYNIQHALDSDYIAWVSISPKPTDTTTLIPTLKEMQEHLGFKYKKVVADAGYESEENYLFLEQNDQLSFIKPSNYEISKTRKYRTDISRRENMQYNSETDSYTCKNGRKLTKQYERKVRSKTGYVSVKTIYQCDDCHDCPYKTKCIRGNNCKTPWEDRKKLLQVSKLFEKKRREDLKRILSDEGCQLRLNRSIQAEGSFAVTKEDMAFRRYLCRGKKNVLAESILVAIAYDLSKLNFKIQSKRCGRHLHPMTRAA